MKSTSSRVRPYLTLISILAMSYCTAGCAELLGLAIAGGVKIDEAVKESNAVDAIAAQRENERKDLESAMELYTVPEIFERHQFSAELYWCHPKEVLPQNVSQDKACTRKQCCERVTIEEAPYIEFKGNKILLESEDSFLRRHRYLDVEKISLEDHAFTANDSNTTDVYVTLGTVNKNFPNRKADYRNSLWHSVLDKTFPNQNQHINELQTYIENFNNHPVVAWIESILPLYQQCADSTHCMDEIISKHLATQVKPVHVSDAQKAEFAYQFETRPNWCYLVFEKAKDASNNDRLIDSMTSDSLTTLSPYDDIQKFRANVEYTNLDLVNQKFHVEGVCTVLPTTAARKQDGFIKGSTPIILGWPRAQVPMAVAMMAEVELHELKQDNVCPVIDRSAEFTWKYTIHGTDAITVQRIPQQAKSNVKTYNVNCSHPYALIDYFKYPVPGTLVWNGNDAYVIAGKSANFKSYTVLRQDGGILTGAPSKLSTQQASQSTQLYNSLDSKCSCAALDPSLPENYKTCRSQKDPFSCCENLLRADLITERDNLQTQYNKADETTKASMGTRLSLLQNENYIQRQIYARCGLDNTKAYDNIEKLFRLEDSYTQGDYPASSGQPEFSPNDLSQHFML